MAYDDTGASSGDSGTSSDGSAKTVVDKILDFALAVGTPLAQRALGPSAEEQAAYDRQAYNRLNGSGSNDWFNAQNVPPGLMDWAFGGAASQKYGQAAGVVMPSGINPIFLMVLGFGAVVVILLMKRR